MELLIPGLILVALMVYASTRIKRSAARAFEAETVETVDFVIQKPEGFLNVIGGDELFAFEAYSKEFGSDAAEKFRLATANVIVRSEGSGETSTNEILTSGGELIEDRAEVIGDTQYRIIERRVTESSVTFHLFSKLAARDGKVFILTIKALAETNPDFMRNIEAMFDSFELK